MVSSIWIKDTRCLSKTQLNSHTSAFLVLEGMQLRWVWCCCWTCTAFIFCRHDLVERCMGAIFAVSTYFLLPLSQHRKGGPWKTLFLSFFSFYEGRVLLLVRIQIHYLLALWSILQCIAAIRNTNIMVDPAFCRSEQTCFSRNIRFYLGLFSLEHSEFN